MNPAESSAEVVKVDGSHGEGGGQIIRNAVSFACILRQKIEVINIRANRPNPGLASQHLESIKAILRLSGGTTAHPPKKKDTSFDLNGSTVLPHSDAPGVKETIDLVTAGSCTLCIQCILPYLLFLNSPSRVRVIGGTHVMKSPSFDYLQRVFLPMFNQILGNKNGSCVKASLERPGYFPRGGGIVILDVLEPNQGNFPAINVTERGNITKIEAILNVTSRMRNDINDLKKAMAKHSQSQDIEERIVSYASVEYFVYADKICAGFSRLVEGRNPNTNQLLEAIEDLNQEVDHFLSTNAPIDGYLQDQLIIYMALAKLSDANVVSRIKTVQPSDHTTSAIHVAQLFAPKNVFQIVENPDKSFDIVL